MEDIMTFKSGKFYFSEKVDSSKVNDLLVRAIVLNETIVDLPILPKLSSRLEPDIMYSSISGTAAIEGNPITEEDVRRIAEGQDIEEYTKKDKQEIINLIKAYSLLSDIEPTETPYILTEELVRELHKIITDQVPDEHNIPGQYRNGIVYVGDKAHGGIYTPPKILDDIKNLMKKFISWINSGEIIKINPFIRASIAHYHFCTIHPFWDGNGRTARLLEAIILQAANIKYMPKELSNFYYRNVDDYYIAFSKTIKLKKDITPFVNYFLNAAVSSLTKIKESIVYFIRIFALRDYYTYQNQQRKITKRQFDLVSLLLDYPANFKLNIKELSSTPPFSFLYNRVSTQTARRDLAKLSKMGLIVPDDKGKYYLNFRILG
jgi:cell filamentation protein, protein adenylyltransferase